MRKNVILSWFVAILGSISLPQFAEAETATPYKYVPQEVQSAAVKELGWDGKLSLGASVNASSNSNVVGRVNGTSFTLGAQINSGLDYIKDVHEWRNRLDIAETVTRTPGIDEFVKSNDILEFETTYLYHIRPIPWFGPFARAKLNTAMFPGRDVRAAAVDYLIANQDGTTQTVTDTSLKLSDPFQPMTLTQVIGAFAQPFNKPHAKLEIKLGFEARETLADNQLSITDDAATAPVEVTELKSFAQGGPSAGALFTGVVSDNKVSYRLLSEVMIPVLKDLPATDTRNSLDLTNVLFEASLSFKLVSWASLDWQFKALREPQLVDKFQVQNNILLTFAYTLISSRQEKK